MNPAQRPRVVGKTLVGLVCLGLLLAMTHREQRAQRVAAAPIRAPQIATPSPASQRHSAPTCAPERARSEAPQQVAREGAEAEAPRERDATAAAPQGADPRAIAGLRSIAQAHLNDEDDADAKVAATQCLRLALSDRECQKVLMSAMMRHGEFDEAEPLVEACLDDDPDDVDCLASAVTLALRRHALDEAQSYARRLREIPDSAPWPDLAEAMVAEARGERPVAVAAFERACSQGQEYACLSAIRLTGVSW